LHAIQRVGWRLPVIREQTHCRVTLFLLVEHLQCLAPRGLLLVINLAQIEHGPLHRPAVGHSPVLDDAEVPMILAVFLPVSAAQEHRNSSMPRKPPAEQRVGLHSACFLNLPMQPNDLQPD
jgi:hypothetical protein